MEPDFLAPRQCFLPPIPELESAATSLDVAAEAFVAGDFDAVRMHLNAANIAAVWDFASRIMGSTKADVHRYRVVVGMPPAEKIKGRMPTPIVQAAIYTRDGYRCRFCECRVFLPAARNKLAAAFPDELVWSGPDRTRHAAFYALSAVVDHLVPHARGGTNDPENLVTTCQSCNYGRNSWLLEEVGLIDPRTRLPKVDAWDGLKRVLAAASP